jgi:hypothetical protein
MTWLCEVALLAFRNDYSSTTHIENMNSRRHGVEFEGLSICSLVTTGHKKPMVWVLGFELAQLKILVIVELRKYINPALPLVSFSLIVHAFTKDLCGSLELTEI